MGSSSAAAATSSLNHHHHPDPTPGPTVQPHLEGLKNLGLKINVGDSQSRMGRLNGLREIALTQYHKVTKSENMDL